jgi:septal ring factor EnvC (AmiA/AmiB activator)
MNEVGSKLADTQKNREQVANLQQQLTDEANKGKALLDQLEKMESKLVDTEKQREELAAQLQKVSR